MTGSGRIELWGCGFNQFNQIDETGNDVFGPKLITSIPCCSNTESVVFHWAGWADLCYSYQDSQNKGKRIIQHRGYNVSEKGLQEIEKALGKDERIECFGREVIEGICIFRLSDKNAREAVETLLFEDDGCVALRPCEEIAMTSTGHVAIIINDGQVLEIYSSITSLFPSSTTIPLLRLTSKPYLLHQPPSSRKFTSLSAGDGHFSFIVNHHWPPSSISIAESYYNKVWSIRTDKRSLNDVAWIPLEEELRGLEEDLFFSVEGSDIISTTLRRETSDENGGFREQVAEMESNPHQEGGKEVEIKTAKLGLFCAEDSDSRDIMDFTISKSNGWITLGLTTEIPSDSFQHLTHGHNPYTPETLPCIGKAYLFPFSRAQSTIPSLRSGEIAFSSILDINCGSEHVMVLLPNGEVWSLGNNTFGQRGIQRDGEVLPGWVKVKGMGMGKVKKIICGKWNSFFIVEQSHGNVE